MLLCGTYEKATTCGLRGKELCSRDEIVLYVTKSPKYSDLICFGLALNSVGDQEPCRVSRSVSRRLLALSRDIWVLDSKKM